MAARRSITSMPSPTFTAPAQPTRRRVLAAGAAAALAAGHAVAQVASAPITGGARPYTIRFSHVVAQDTPKGLAALRFQALVQERSGGRMDVAIYPEGQLYGDRDEMQALQLGAVEILAPSLSKFGRIGFPEFELFDLPFLFPDVASVRRVTQGPLGARLLERLQRQRLVGLGFMGNGFKHMSANRPLLSPGDFVGQRMRIQASRVLEAQMRALNAQPVTLAFSETHRALALAVVDGTENPVSNFWTQDMHEVQSHLSLTQHGYLGYAVVTSQRFLAALSSPDRELVRGAMGEAMAFADQIADTQNDNALAALRADGRTQILVPTQGELDTLRTAVLSVHKGLAKRIGPQWLADVQDALSSSS